MQIVFLGASHYFNLMSKGIDTQDATQPGGDYAVSASSHERAILLDGRYRLLEPLARGGMGSVFRAFDEREERTVALKVLTRVTENRARERFLREIGLAFRCNHPNIVSALGYGIHDGMPFLVMEHLEGTNLREHLKNDVRLNEQDSLLVAAQILEALTSIHAQKLLHRDLKPANIFLKNHSCSDVKLLDFGVARNLAARSRITAENALIGTPCYLPPERLLNYPEGPPSDVYGVGVILFESLTGRRAFPLRDGENITSVYQRIIAPGDTLDLSGQVSSGVKKLLSRALEVEASLRFPNAASMLTEVRHLQYGNSRSDLSGARPRILSSSRKKLKKRPA